MKFVIEKDGSAVSPVNVWTPGLAEKCGLKGNLNAPQNLPCFLRDGQCLRKVRVEKTVPGKYQTRIEGKGSIVENEWIIQQKAIDLPLNIAKQQTLQEIKRRRDEILNGDFTWSKDGKLYSIQGSDADMSKMERIRHLLDVVKSRGAELSQTMVPWRTSDNLWTAPLKSEEITTMIEVKGQQQIVCWERYRELEEKIKSQETNSIEKICALDLEAGWAEAANQYHV
ncbi:MAG: hypothetical protein V7776_21880 [Halopseudomonas aestusnigri]